MRMQLYTRVRLLTDRLKHDKLLHKGAECTIISARTLKTRGHLYRVEILDQRCNSHWAEVEAAEIEPVAEPEPLPRTRVKKKPKRA